MKNNGVSKIITRLGVWFVSNKKQKKMSFRILLNILNVSFSAIESVEKMTPEKIKYTKYIFSATKPIRCCTNASYKNKNAAGHNANTVSIRPNWTFSNHFQQFKHGSIVSQAFQQHSNNDNNMPCRLLFSFPVHFLLLSLILSVFLTHCRMPPTAKSVSNAI